MKTKNPVLSTLLIAVLLISFTSWGDASAQALRAEIQNGVLYVKPGGEGDCSSWDKACDLQDALTKSIVGDQIWAAEGTYKPTTGTDRSATFQLESGVALYGGFAGIETSLTERDWVNNLTTLSGNIGVPEITDDNSYHVVTGSDVDATAILDGFSITGGNADGNPAFYDDSGGGLYNYSGSPTLKNLTFLGNSADYNGGGMCNSYYSSPTLNDVIFSVNNSFSKGGGLDNYYSSPKLTNVTFSSNTASYEGGGLHNFYSSPSLTAVTFNSNTAISGGGMYNYESSPSLTKVIFSENTVSGDDSYGGGIFNTYDSRPNLTDVTFSDNSASHGGGMYNEINSNPTLTNVTFSENTATQYGGGMYNLLGSNPTLTNVTFSDNSAVHFGGGIYNSFSSPILTNVTIYANEALQGGGIYNAGDTGEPTNPTVTNAIIWGNIGGQIGDGTNSWAAINYSVIQDGYTAYTGTGNITDNPNLDSVLANNGGFTMTHALLEGSPAIDAGDPNKCPKTDQRGFYRPIDGDDVIGARCDMGAYEYGSALFLFLPIIVR